jgi:hypothetical protein
MVDREYWSSCLVQDEEVLNRWDYRGGRGALILTSKRVLEFILSDSKMILNFEADLVAMDLNHCRKMNECFTIQRPNTGIREFPQPEGRILEAYRAIDAARIRALRGARED